MIELMGFIQGESKELRVNDNLDGNFDRLSYFDL